jgi:hypothetical protein
MRGTAARLLAIFALLAVLHDGSACLVALAAAPGAGEPSELAYRAPCPCGCAQHAATLAGVGLAQLAAPPALAAMPVPERPLPPRAPDSHVPSVPPLGVDHVPISLS